MLSRLRTRRRRDRVWFLVSLWLHALALAAIVYLTPVRQIVRDALAQRTRPEQTMSSGAIEDLSEHLEAQAAAQIAGNARELEGVFSEIMQIQKQMGEEFKSFDSARRQRAAEEAREEMQDAIEKMQQAANGMAQDAEMQQIDRAQALAEHAQERAARKLAMVGFDVEEARKLQERARQAHQQAKTAQEAHRDQRTVIRQGRTALEETRQQHRDLRERLAQMKQGDASQNAVDRMSERVSAHQQLAQEQAQQVAEAERERKERLDTARKAQERAVAAQQEALQSLQKTVKRHVPHVVSSGTAGPADHAANGDRLLEVDPPERTAEEISSDVPELYTHATRMEDRIARVFKEVRAVDLAMVRDLELQEARDDIDVIRPVRPSLNAELLEETVRDGQKFEAHKEEMSKALRETASMVSLAYRMLEMSKQSAADLRFGTAVGAPQDGREVPEFDLVIRELAMEEVSGRFSDMSGVMLQATQQAAPQEAQAGGDAAAPAPQQDFEDLTRQPEGQTAVQFGQEGEVPGNLPQLTPQAVSVGARKLSPAGRPARWMYIDGWYTIGPFPNPKRVNIDREFPPDSMVDLDATYVGKNGQTIRWQFVQSDGPNVVPANPDEYGIWYAYTEFYCDRPRDVIIALGSDDRGILKVNGVPVWISSKRLKGWDIDEVWRRVHFRQGVNRILYRIENGWIHVGFSMVLMLEPNAQ